MPRYIKGISKPEFAPKPKLESKMVTHCSTTGKPFVRIEDWFCTPQMKQLSGRVFDHPYIAEGDSTTTSRMLKRYDLPIDQQIVIETRNTMYILGKPSPGAKLPKLPKGN